MPKSKKRRSKSAGLPPGTLIHVGEQKTAQVKITLLDYDEASLQEKELASVQECLPFRDRPTRTWINIDGLHQVDAIERLGKHFGLHPLVLEDIVNTEQRPKLEDFGEYMFLVTKMLSYDEAAQQVIMEQVSLVLGANFIMSFQEGAKDDFIPIRQRIINGNGRMRTMGVDYLLYALLDAIVDHYFLVLDKLGEQLEILEETLLANPTQAHLKAVHKLRREFILIRKAVWPLRDVVATLERRESALIKSATTIYLRDLFDHLARVIDTVENYRDLVSVLLDIYLSSLSNKMNEVMKTLTIITTIFIPLSFIAGIYGMNFEHMPELRWQWSYPAVLLVMVAIGVAMVFYFKKRKWF